MLTINKGISNFRTDRFLKEEDNEELKKNYMRTFSIDSVTKYIDFYSIIKNRNAKYLLQYLTRLKKMNQEHTGGVF